MTSTNISSIALATAISALAMAAAVPILSAPHATPPAAAGLIEQRAAALCRPMRLCDAVEATPFPVRGQGAGGWRLTIQSVRAWSAQEQQRFVDGLDKETPDTPVLLDIRTTGLPQAPRSPDAPQRAARSAP